MSCVFTHYEKYVNIEANCYSTSAWHSPYYMLSLWLMTFTCRHGLLRHEPLCLAMTVGRIVFCEWLVLVRHCELAKQSSCMEVMFIFGLFRVSWLLITDDWQLTTFTCRHGLLRHEPLCLAMTCSANVPRNDLFKSVIASLRSNPVARSDVYFLNVLC